MIRKFLGYSLYLVFLLLLCEGILWIIASFSESTNLLLSNQFGAPRIIHDPLLGHRPNPDFAEHDEWGYRNALVGRFGLRSRAVPERVDIIAIGDSQTYGVNAPAEKTWPAQLSDRTCRGVYNMGVGATGPPHYLYDLDRALTLSPMLVIIGFYFGNDFWDSADFVYGREQVPKNMEAWRQSFLQKNKTLEVFFKQQRAKIVRMSIEAAKILEPGFSTASDSNGQEEANTIENETNITGFLRENSKLYGFLRLAKAFATNPVVRKGRHDARTRADPEFWGELCDYAADTRGVTCYETADMQTVLDTRLRIRDERTLRAGMEIALDVIRIIQGRLQETKTDYLVLLIPTKEYIYTQALPGRFESVDETFVEIGIQEGRIRDQLKRELGDRGIPYLDLLGDLIGEVQENHAIYPASSQSHPSSYGYGVIAQSVARYLQELGWGPVGC